MATTILSPQAKQQFFDNAGNPASGFRLYTYASNTMAPRTTYSDRAGTVPNTNPIVLDARGEATVYLIAGAVYDYVLKTGDDALVWTREDVVADAGDGTAVSFLQAGTGAVPRSMQDKERDWVSIMDFGAVGDGVTDDTVAVQKAFDYCVASGKSLYCPAGKYKTTVTIFVTGAIKVYGEGWSVARGAQAPGPGTWFYLAHLGKGFFLSTINSGGLFEGFGTYRDHAAPGPGWTPTVYDWDMEMNTASNEWTWRNVMLLNPYRGIKASNRPTFEGVKMQPFKTGILTDDCRDVARFKDVHVWPFWSENTNVRDNMMGNLDSYHFMRADNPQIVSCFSIWHKTGVLIDGDGAGNTSYRALISNSNFESGAVALQFTPGADGATVHIVNSILHGADEIALSFGVLMECDNARLQLSNVELANFGAYAMQIDGAGNLVPLSNTHVSQWNKSNGGYAAISVGVGNTVYQEVTTFLGGNGATVWSGAGLMFGYTGGGEVNQGTDASGDLTITHNLRYTPRRIFVQQAEPDTGYFLRVHSRNASSFKVRVKNDAGATVTGSGGIQVFWQAESL